MTAAQIRRSVEKQKLQLNRSQRFNHFLVAHGTLFVGLCLPSIIFLNWLIELRFNSVLSVFQVILFSAPWIVASILLYFYQKRVLSLSKVATPLKVSEIRQILSGLAQREGWSVLNSNKAFVVMKTHPGFTWNWGEKITILFYKEEVWVNSICDPDNEPAVYSSGRNKRNRRLIHQFLSGNRHLNG